MTDKSKKVLLMASIMFVTLVWLGLWQWQRMGWKQEILTLIERNSTAAPISLQLARQKSIGEIGGINKAEYSRINVSGRYHHDKTRYFFAQSEGQTGWLIYTPFEYQPDSFVFVNRGFIPADYKTVKASQVARPEQQVNILGLFRMGLLEKPSRFVLDNAIAKNNYFWRSIKDMAKGSFGSKAYVLAQSANAAQQKKSANDVAALPVGTVKILPFSIDLEKNDHKGQWPRAGTTILKPANSHFTYMMTWFSFALTLLMITGIFLAGERRKS